MYYLATDFNSEKRMKIALLAAAVIHGCLILGVGFIPASSEPQYAPQIEVTFATRSSETAPEDARLKAQTNQHGSGNEADRMAFSPPAATLPAAGNGLPSSRAQRERERILSNSSLLSSEGPSAQKTAREANEAEQQAAGMQGMAPEVDKLARELAELEARLNQQNQAYSNRQRVRRITSASALASADAAYLQGWRQRLESVGNKFYPEASVRYGLYGDLRLLVIIRADGSLEDIKILSTSGYDALDEAAIKIVRMAAPFAPFSDELKATTDKLEIVRTWKFQENKLSSGLGYPTAARSDLN
jgi:periplasmic protein TonB